MDTIKSITIDDGGSDGVSWNIDVLAIWNDLSGIFNIVILHWANIFYCGCLNVLSFLPLLAGFSRWRKFTCIGYILLLELFHFWYVFLPLWVRLTFRSVKISKFFSISIHTARFIQTIINRPPEKQLSTICSALGEKNQNR